MGCCISSNKATKKNPSPQKDLHLQNRALVPESDTLHDTKQHNPKLQSSLPSPLPLLEEEEEEEETVKEVLSSETPTQKPYLPKFQQQKILRLPSFPKIEEEKRTPFEEISEVSEICSLSESVSTVLTERSREDGEVIQQRIERSPGNFPRKRSVSGEIYGKTERSEQWLSERRDNAGKSVHSREVGQISRRRNLTRNGSLLRDPGESSARRSRSPATRIDTGAASRPGMCRSPSKRVVRSADRIPVNSPEIGRKFEESKGENWPPAKESLEDPLVSLECFIFL